MEKLKSIELVKNERLRQITEEGILGSMMTKNFRIH